MYLVTIDNNLLHDPRIKDYQILNPVLNLEVNKTHSFNFTIYPNNPMFNSIERLKSIIEVYDDGELIFRGRPLNDTADFNKATTIQCEGELAYLNDSTMEPYSYFGTVRGLLELYINNHNAQVDASKQFTLGTVNVVGDFVRSNIDYTNTWEELSTKTFGSGMGGYLRLRRENDINYIDYLADSSYISGQTIELSKNLLDYEKTVKASDIVTVLIPLGAKLKDEEGNELDERLTIESVNSGSKFIEHASGIAKYGRIVGYKVWDDINSPSLLKTRATNDLNFLVNLGISIKIKAVDLNILDKSIPKIRFFEYVKIISKPHEIDDSMLIKKQTIHLDDPSQNTIEVGVEVSSFTDKQLEANNTIKIIKSDYVTNEKMTNVITPITVQVSQIIQEADRIELSVSELRTDLENTEIGGSNLLINGSGELKDFTYWTFYPTNARLMFHKSLLYRKALTNYTIFDIVTNENSLSGNNLSFFANGKALNGLFRTYPDNEYGFRFKRVSGNQDFNIEIHEFNENKGYIGKQVYTFDNSETYGTINNITFESETSFFALLYDVQASFSNRLVLTELMLNVGNPKTYEKNPDVIEESIRIEVLNRITRVETETTAKITTNTEAITLEKSERETQYGTLSDTVSKQGSSITLLNDQINTTIKSRLDDAEETVESINETISTVESTQQTFTDRITNLEGEMTQQQTFFRTEIDGLTIGGTDWETVMHANGERISFQSQTGSVQAQFGVGGMYVNRWETDFHAIEKFEEGNTKGTIYKNRRGGS